MNTMKSELAMKKSESSTPPYCSSERLVKLLNEAYAKQRPKISGLLDGAMPYTADDMKGETHAIKARVKGIGWVEVKTTTQFISNGLLKQAEARIKSGEYVKCEPPKKESA